jgi:Zn-dependent protease
MVGSHISLQEIVMYLLAFLTAVTVHEYAHARVALAAGDETAKRQGRISLNPIDHLDPVGTVMFVVTMLNGFGLAWGKPVPINPSNFKSPRWDLLRVSIAGPVSNIITAIALSVLLRLMGHSLSPTLVLLIVTCIMFNLGLAIFNMLPIPPLDGSKVLISLLPARSARNYEYAMSKYGMAILLIVLITGIGGRIISPPIHILANMLIQFGLGGPSVPSA